MGQSNGDEMEVVMVEVENEEGRERVEEEVKWGDFMPRMMLRVLLVEADDCTRHIITALLRKCNYKVAAVADGLKAWEVLKRQHSNIDLILTELDLPSISGYALLTLIMEHDGCKNIPVVVMSSQDSISMVLKCMLKGAADFLIKPVRKNELKNLWRHVWRRLATNSGPTPQDLTAEQHRVEAAYENNPATNQSSDNVSTSRKSLKHIEKPTDAHSSCSTPYLDAERECMENMQDVSPEKSSAETGLDNKDMKLDTKVVELEKESALHVSMAGEKAAKLEAGSQLYKDIDASPALEMDEDGSCTGIATEYGSVDQGNHRHKASADGFESSEPFRGAIDFIGGMFKQKSASGQTSCNGEFSGLNATPELELSLRRCHDLEPKEVDEGQALNHSTGSAFSWYSSGKKLGSFAPSSVSELTDVKDAANLSQWPNVMKNDGENKHNLGAQIGAAPKPVNAFDGGVWTNASTFQQMFSPPEGPGPDSAARSPKAAFHREDSPFLTSTSLHSDPGNSSTVNHSSGQADYYEPKTGESVERTVHSSSQIVDPSGSSTPCNDFGSQNKIKACGSASDITDLNATGPVMTSTSAVEETSRDEGCTTFDLDQFKHKAGLHSAEREAALAKFRLKRKGRCFEKKVRYQSRKRLAEQRPRVKGQFVRQIPTDQKLAADDKSLDISGCC